MGLLLVGAGLQVFGVALLIWDATERWRRATAWLRPLSPEERARCRGMLPKGATVGEAQWIAAAEEAARELERDSTHANRRAKQAPGAFSPPDPGTLAGKATREGAKVAARLRRTELEADRKIWREWVGGLLVIVGLGLSAVGGLFEA